MLLTFTISKSTRCHSSIFLTIFASGSFKFLDLIYFVSINFEYSRFGFHVLHHSRYIVNTHLMYTNIHSFFGNQKTQFCHFFIQIKLFSSWQSALKLEKNAISKVQKHIFCIFKSGKKSIFAPEKSLKLPKMQYSVWKKQDFW